MLPYWYDAIVPDLRRDGVVLVAAHGNSLRALIKHLDGMGDDEVVALNVPTGIPLHYELDDTTLRPTGPGSYLDPDAAQAAIEAVAAPGQEVAAAGARASPSAAAGCRSPWRGSGRSPVTMKIVRRATATAWSA